MAGIIDRWGNKDRSPNDYIFRVLVPGLSVLGRYSAIGSFVHYINLRMLKIGKQVGIKKNLQQ